jgi:hypothetical protein
MMSKNFLIGVGVGAAILYIADPPTGRRRRALTRRTLGLVAARRRRRTSEAVDDRRLVERVRARIGHTCSHPRVIDVKASDGTVTLSGPILAGEVTALVGALWNVPGLRGIKDELTVHHSAEGVPSLQGEGSAASTALGFLRRRWVSAPRALLTASGLGATALMAATYARR